MIKASNLDRILDNFLNEIKILSAALIVDANGMIIAQKSNKKIDKTIIGATMSLLEEAIKRIKKFAESSYSSGTFNTDEYQLFYLELGGTNPALFVIVVDMNVNLEKYIPYSYLVAEKVSLILNNINTDFELPNFNVDGELRFKKEQNLITDKSYLNKILVLGDERVGKSSLLNTYVNGTFLESYKPTIGVSIFEKELLLTKRSKVNLYLYDFGGLKSFAKIREFYYKNSKAKVIIIVFDYTQEKSINAINKWLEEIKFYNNNSFPCCIILVGNKIDLLEERSANKKKVEKIAKLNNCLFFETSALTGQGLDEIFMHIAFNIDFYD